MKYVLKIKVYVLNEQVSKYVIMLFFPNNTSILSFVLTGYGFVTKHALHAFSITRPLNARLCKVWPECCMMLKSHEQGSDFVFF